MKTTHVTAATVWVLAMLLLAPLEATAGARGSGMQSSHIGGRVVRGHHFPLARHHFGPLARQHFRSVRNQAFGSWPWYGYYDVPPYTYDDSMTYPTPETVMVRPDPPQPRCQHNEQTRTVPSVNGGTTEVTILRC